MPKGIYKRKPKIYHSYNPGFNSFGSLRGKKPPANDTRTVIDDDHNWHVEDKDGKVIGTGISTPKVKGNPFHTLWKLRKS